MKILIRKGADINAKNNNGESALMFSSLIEGETENIKKYESIMNLLIENGADVNMINNRNDSALIIFLDRGNLSRNSMNCCAHTDISK